MKKSGTRSSAFVKSGQGEQGFWSSYADMMSAVALVLFFLMLLSYIQNLITGNNLRSTQTALDDTQTQLSLTASQVKDAQNELALITQNLEAAKEELALQQALADEQAKNLAAIRTELDEKQALIAQQTSDLDKQKALAARQEKYLASTQAELTELRGQMQTIAVLRLSILEQIKESIEKVMGENGTVSIGDNGSIILSESILFEIGSSKISDGSTMVLNQLAKVFQAFLADNENAKYVDSIVISGHTDNTGTEWVNRPLSTDRANSVLNYLLSANSSALQKNAAFFCAAGYGSSRPVADNATIEGRAANRRIEISMILKDETVLDIVDQYLAIEIPNA